MSELSELSEWVSELDKSRCKRIEELVARIEELVAKADQQEHYYQMNVARIGELEAALRDIVNCEELACIGDLIENARHALEGKP